MDMIAFVSMYWSDITVCINNLELLSKSIDWNTDYKVSSVPLVLVHNKVGLFHHIYFSLILVCTSFPLFEQVKNQSYKLVNVLSLSLSLLVISLP